MSDNNSNTSEYFVSVKRSSLPSLVFTVLMVVTGILLLFYSILGLIPIFIGLLLLLHKPGVEVDMQNRKYRNSGFIFNKGIGPWQKLPDVQYISVFKASEVSAVRGLTNTRVSQKQDIIKVNFIYDRTRRLTIYQTSDIQDAFQKAKILADGLHLKIYDATGSPQGWIEKEDIQ
ncbi:MAG: hypothetical protein ACQES0_09945 [Bacteroidota bacterium]